MRITHMHIRGRDGEHTAALAREPGSPCLEVRIATPTLRRTRSVRADDHQDLWSMAECLQQTLEGFRGSGGDVREYLASLQLMSDL